ncbi:FAD-binding dehydrogenase [Glutamicibacter uratoxydans]|uniref:FAD-binding dehydrogenase n=1 Tax=Glutamicibacter uratoxydans TaxID=43667 RepID=A0A4Y4DM62_GLUUR|nr:FAD-binding dehydrogenase [Glutamicibacter uratoxydans]GED06412.1 FAD-binding dehydrogenase [Glutamicibacter uratoxydans]
MEIQKFQADVIVIGAGLSGLVAAAEMTSVGLKVIVVDQENSQNWGGQAHWSFGGLFLVDSPEQRHLGVRDSFDLAWSDWLGSAQFNRMDDQDSWAYQWAQKYVEFAAGEKRTWIADHGIELTPVVGWAERGDGRAQGHGNSVPRFHICWGTGTGVSEPFVRHAVQAQLAGKLHFLNRCKVTSLLVDAGQVIGCRGQALVADASPRGVASSRRVIGEFEVKAEATLITTGGIGGNHELVRKFWPERLGNPPKRMLTGVPAYVDGSGLDIAERAGARLVNRDRMWHYTEGVHNWDPIWPGHGIRILPGPSSLWIDAQGKRLPAPGIPGHDTIGTLKILRTGPKASQFDHSWFVLNQRIIEKEFALSGSEQNPDITERNKQAVIKDRIFGSGAPKPVSDFLKYGEDFLTADTLEELTEKMNASAPEAFIDSKELREQIEARDRQVANPFSKDAQIQSIRNARRYIGDRLMRVVSPRPILDGKSGPLIAVKLHTLTRKSLGGIQTDLSGRALKSDGTALTGLYAAGEASGFGGGGMHGYNALEGTFLGGCLFSGRETGRGIVRDLGI